MKNTSGGKFLGKERQSTKRKPAPAAVSCPEAGEGCVNQTDTRPGPVKARAFLRAYRMTGQVKKAAELAKISRRLHYLWLERYPKYKLAWENARRKAGQVFEDELIRRALEGHLEPVFYQGKAVGAVRRYPDHLLLEACKTFLPDIWKKRVEHTGKDGGPIAVKDYRLEDLSDEDLAALVLILKKAGAEKKEP